LKNGTTTNENSDSNRISNSEAVVARNEHTSVNCSFVGAPIGVGYRLVVSMIMENNSRIKDLLFRERQDDGVFIIGIGKISTNKVGKVEPEVISAISSILAIKVIRAH